MKLNVLKILFEKYGIIEEDLVSAELEVVPALKARDVGLDRSLMASYGHDDRVCAYTALTGLIDSSSSLKKILQYCWLIRKKLGVMEIPEQRIIFGLM